MHSLRENSAAGAPVKAFRGVTPGLRACKAPVQQRPTAPNIFKMAEGGMGRRSDKVYIQLRRVQSAHALSMAAPSNTHASFSEGRLLKTGESMGNVFLVSILI